MIILIDTREQKPLEFPYEYVEETNRVTLKVGDYSCLYKDNYVPQIIFERKAIGDLFSTMGQGYGRFKRELETAKELNIKLILVIEGSITKIIKGTSHSSLKGISILRKLLTLWIKYGLDFHCFRNREEMSLFIYEYFCSIGRLKVKRKNP